MEDGPLEHKAKKSVLWGCASILLSPLPLISFLLSFRAIYLGYRGKSSLRHRRAKIGIFLGSLGLILVSLSSLFWIPFINDVVNSPKDELVLSKETFIDPTGQFSIVPPEHWTSKATDTEEGSEIQFTSRTVELVDITHTFRPTIIIRSGPDPSLITSPSSPLYRDRIRAGLKTQFSEHGIGSGGPLPNLHLVNINGNDAYVFDTIDTSNSRMTFHLFGQLVIDWNHGKMIFILAAAPESLSEKYRALFEQVLESFTIR